MATTLTLLASLIVCAVVIPGVASQACSYPPCFSVPANETFYYPNWNNCSTYWKCANKQQSLEQCQPGLDFDLFTSSCVPAPTQASLDTQLVLTCNIVLNGIDSLSRN